MLQRLHTSKIYSFKKENEVMIMSKKVNDILKGVAGVGAAIGGANVLAESNVVYAVELKNEELLEEQDLELTQEGSASQSMSVAIETSEANYKEASESLIEALAKSEEAVSEANSLSASTSTQLSELNAGFESAKAAEALAKSELADAEKAVYDAKVLVELSEGKQAEAKLNLEKALNTLNDLEAQAKAAGREAEIAASNKQSFAQVALEVGNAAVAARNEVNQLIAEVEKLDAEAKEIKADYDAKVAEVEKLSKEAEELSKVVDQLRINVRDLEQDVAKATRLEAEALASLEEATVKEGVKAEALAKGEEELRQLNVDLDGLNADLAALNADLAVVNTEIDSLNGAIANQTDVVIKGLYDDLTAKKLQLLDDIAAKEADIATLNIQLEQAKAALNAEIEAQKGVIKGLEDDAVKYAADAAELRAEVDDWNATLVEEQAKVPGLKSALTKAETNKKAADAEVSRLEGLAKSKAEEVKNAQVAEEFKANTLLILQSDLYKNNAGTTSNDKNHVDENGFILNVNKYYGSTTYTYWYVDNSGTVRFEKIDKDLVSANEKTLSLIKETDHDGENLKGYFYYFNEQGILEKASWISDGPNHNFFFNNEYVVAKDGVFKVVEVYDDNGNVSSITYGERIKKHQRVQIFGENYYLHKARLMDVLGTDTEYVQLGKDSKEDYVTFKCRYSETKSYALTQSVLFHKNEFKYSDYVDYANDVTEYNKKLAEYNSLVEQVEVAKGNAGLKAMELIEAEDNLAAVAGEEGTIATLTSNINANTTEAARLDGVVKDIKESQIPAANAVLAGLEARTLTDFVELEKQIADEVSNLAKLEAAKAFTAENANIQAAETELANLSAQLAAKNEVANGINAKITFTNSAIATKNTQIADKDREVEGLLSALNEAKGVTAERKLAYENATNTKNGFIEQHAQTTTKLDEAKNAYLAKAAEITTATNKASELNDAYEDKLEVVANKKLEIEDAEKVANLAETKAGIANKEAEAADKLASEKAAEADRLKLLAEAAKEDAAASEYELNYIASETEALRKSVNELIKDVISASQNAEVAEDTTNAYSEKIASVTSDAAYNSESTSDSASDSASEAKSLSAYASEVASESMSTVISESESTSTSFSASTSESESTSESASISESVSESESTSASDSVSESESTSVSDSVSASESTSTSESESASESTSISESVSESESTSESETVSESESTSVSDSVSASESTSVSETVSASESETVSESESTSESETVSASESETVSESESTSESETESESESTSESETESESESTSESETESESESTSESETESESESTSESETTDEEDDSEDENQPEAETAPVAPTDDVVEIEDEETPLADGEDEEVEIEDEDVPLGVVDEEDTGMVEIEDEETPLASGAKEEPSNRPWWLALIATAVAAVTGKTVYDKNKKKVVVDKDNK